MHARDYKDAAEFAGQHVLVVGAGISAIQLLDEISRVPTTSWVSRTPPQFRDGSFIPEDGRAAVKLVEDRVRQGLPLGSVVSVTGLPRSPAIEAMQQRGVLHNQPMFDTITPQGCAGPMVVNWRSMSFCGSLAFAARSITWRRCNCVNLRAAPP
ncbi:MAG: hypothetical protein MO852_14695 [Candidatus Devosia euplotis]|nr:hypothetical protein [Candidatus Devosia euplotis]